MHRVWVMPVLLVVLICIPQLAAAETLYIPIAAEAHVEAITPAVERFERDHPNVKVEIIRTPSDYEAKILTMIASGVAPDIVVRDIGGTPLSWWLDGYLLDLTPFVQKNQDHFADWVPAFLNTGVYQGKYFAIPIGDANVYINWFNRRLFEAAGLMYPDGSWDFDSFRQQMRKLCLDKDGDGKFDQYGYHHAWKTWLPFLYNNGGGVQDPQDPSRLLLDSPQSQAAFNYLQQLQFVDGVLAPDHNFNGSRAERALAEGRAAVIARSATAYRNLPSNLKDGSTLGIVLDPVGQGPRHTMTVLPGMSIPAASKNIDLAWKLILYITDLESQRQLKASGGGIVTNHRVNMEFFPSRLPVWNFDQTIQTALSLPTFNAAYMMPNITKNILETIIDAILINNTMPVAIAMETYVPQLKQELQAFFSKMR